jgi:hypothetical protein
MEVTTMKRAFLALFALSFAALAWAQPKVAVLDTIIPQNMDPSVIVPTTEKIIERLVVSGRFTVLDRANIESVLKEREFQVSGMVSDQDVVTAGKYLGADFVVVAKVQRVDTTYFISAKMIAIKTGVIANQTSAEGDGKLSVLIGLAERVGEVLSGGAVLAQSAAGESSDISKAKPAKPIAPETKPAVVVKTGKPKKAGWPIVLNIIPGFGLGSYVEGDVLGGLVGTGSTVLFYVFSNDAGYSNLSAVGALVTGVFTLTYGIVRPITFANKYNKSHGLASIDLMPSISTTSIDGAIVAAPGAILKLSY